MKTSRYMYVKKLKRHWSDLHKNIKGMSLLNEITYASMYTHKKRKKRKKRRATKLFYDDQKNTLVFYFSLLVHNNMCVDVDWVDDSGICVTVRKNLMWYHCTERLKTDVYYISPCIFTYNKPGRGEFFFALGFVWSVVWDYEIFHFLWNEWIKVFFELIVWWDEFMKLLRFALPCEKIFFMWTKMMLEG